MRGRLDRQVVMSMTNQIFVGENDRPQLERIDAGFAIGFTVDGEYVEWFAGVLTPAEREMLAVRLEALTSAIRCGRTALLQ